MPEWLDTITILVAILATAVWVRSEVAVLREYMARTEVKIDSLFERIARTDGKVDTLLLERRAAAPAEPERRDSLEE